MALLSVSGFGSSKIVQIRIYNVTTATEVVAWTSTGVSERADGQGYSTYYYSYALVAGQEYIVDWKDNSSPIQTASEGINVLQSGVAQITAKLPTDYIMGSIVLTAKDDEIDAILTETQSHPTLAEIEATTILAKEATINTKIPTALTFTGSDVKATLDGEEVTPTTASKTGYALSTAGIQAIWDALTSALTAVGSIGKKLADWVVGTIDTYTGNTKQTGDVFPLASTEIADIKAKTDNLPSDPASNTQVNTRLATASYISPDNASIAAILADTGTDGVVVATRISIKKNTALANFTFEMIDSTDHISAKIGLVVTAQRSIDGSAYALCANGVTEVGNGTYKISLAATDTNGDVLEFRFTAVGADETKVTVITQGV